MYPYQPMQRDVSMSMNRYVDTAYSNQAFFPTVSARYLNPTISKSGNIIDFDSEQDLENYLNRENKSILAYVYCSSDPSQVSIIQDILKPLVRGTVTKIVLIDQIKFYRLACKYGYKRTMPFVMRLIRGNVLRFLNKSFTYKNVRQFITSTSQWRSKGFYVLDISGT